MQDSIKKVRDYLKPFGIDDKIMELPVSSATVALAAQAVGTEPARIAKTLAFDIDGTSLLIVCAGDTKIDNAKYKARFHAKAKMLPPDEVPDRIGHAVGGVCPFAREKRGVHFSGYIAETLPCRLSRVRKRKQRHRAHPRGRFFVFPALPSGWMYAS